MKSRKINAMLIAAILILATILFLMIPKTTFSQVTPHNEQIKICCADEAVSVANYTDDTHEPTGWELFPSIFWDDNNNGIFETNESIGHAMSPCVHFTHDAQTYHFWPLHQSIMQDPGDPHVVSSGWISQPNIYRSKVEDADQLLTIECTVSVLDGNNYFTQDINVTSTATSTLTNVNLMTYIGIDINGPLNDYAFINSSFNNMLEACDNETGIWFGAYPTISADNFEVSEWDDGPYDGEDVWQHTVNNGLDGATASSGDVEGALEFHLYEVQPGESKNLTIYYSLGTSEGDLYVPVVPGRDVAVTNVSSPKTVACQTCCENVTVTVENQGTYPAAFNVTLYANKTIVQKKNITLTIGESANMTFLWNTTGWAKGNYTLKAVADTVPGETDTTDNTYIDEWIIVSMIGDITGPTSDPDGKCDIRDVAMVAKLFGVIYPDPDYDPNCDLTGPTTGVPDGKIDIRDVALIAKHFGEIDP